MFFDYVKEEIGLRWSPPFRSTLSPLDLNLRYGCQYRSLLNWNLERYISDVSVTYIQNSQFTLTFDAVVATSFLAVVELMVYIYGIQYV